MIKIINGVFGFNNGITVTPKTPKDEPFEAPAEIEARLVKEGVAVYVVEGPAKDDEAPAEDNAAENAEDNAEDDAEDNEGPDFGNDDGVAE